tara:strand:- start:316 stop:1458 length:1143 start_codon:yes stop_codon:yes gene_type:complete
MAITYSPEEYIAALGDLTPLVNEAGGLQGIDILNQYAGPGSVYNIPNGGLGGFSPATDPNYSSGQNYARSIAGGMPMSQIMAPGVSYSPGDPTGYTQQQLNAPMQAPIPPKQEFREPDDTSVLGRGIGGYSMPYDRKQQLPPVEKLFGSIPSAPAQAPGFDFGNIDIDAIRQQIADSGIDFTNLFGLPSQQQDLSQFVTKKDLPAMIPQVPNGSDFSIENLNLPDFSNFVTQQDLPVYDQPDLSQFITQQDLPAFNPKDYRDDFLSIAREGIEMPSYEQPDLSSFAKLTDIPTFDPSGLQQQIGGLEQQIAGMPQFNPQDYRDDFLSIAREGIEMPSYQAPDLSGYDTRLADLEKTLLSLQQPVANDRFSVNQLNPKGLF